MLNKLNRFGKIFCFFLFLSILVTVILVVWKKNPQIKHLAYKVNKTIISVTGWDVSLLSLAAKKRCLDILGVERNVELKQKNVFDAAQCNEKSNSYSEKNNSVNFVSKGQPYFGIIDSAGFYQKNGRVESYGLELHQLQSGPIKVAKTELTIMEDVSAFVWFPERAVVNSNSSLHLEIQKHDENTAKNIFIGVSTNKGTLLFSNDGSKVDIKKSQLELPDDVKNFLSSEAKAWGAGKRRGEYITEPLSTFYESQVPDLLDVNAVFIIITGMNGKKIEIDTLSIRPNQIGDSLYLRTESESGINLIGQLQGAKVPIGDYVYLRTEDNTIKKTQLNLEEQFVFSNVKPGSVVSIWYEYNDMDYYSHVGRWFEVVPGHGALTIDLTPTFLNLTGAMSDPESYYFVGKKKVAPQDNDYEPHSRMAWHGLNIIKCYENFPFTNNLGYLDRDRKIENPNKCLRIVHVGGSSSAALQVKTHEKFNILLEQELGIRLGRCVEVISIARDNGDIGTHFKRIKYFTENYNPDLVLIENLSGLMMQIEPNLLKKLHGFNFEHNIFPHFYYDNDTGKLKFAELSADYAFFVEKADYTPLVDDVPLVQSLGVPYDVMDPSSKNAWKYLRDIVMHYKKLYPNQKFALHTGIDLAQCRYPCKDETSSKGYLYGAHGFTKNHKEFCKKEGIVCFDPEINDGQNKHDALLSFPYDGHYSPRGHQWVAKQLGRLLYGYFKNNEREYENG